MPWADTDEGAALALKLNMLPDQVRNVHRLANLLLGIVVKSGGQGGAFLLPKRDENLTPPKSSHHPVRLNKSLDSPGLGWKGL